MSWQCRLDLPVGTWVALPLDEVDPAGAACDLAVELAADLPDEDAEGLREELPRMSAAAQQAGAVLAAVLLTPDADAVLALLQVLPLALEGAPDLQELALAPSAGGSDVLGEPRVTLVELAAGPAVRVRQLVSAGDGEAVLENLDHLVVAPGADPEVVLVPASWTSLLVGDAIAEIVDECVATLVMEPALDA